VTYTEDSGRKKSVEGSMCAQPSEQERLKTRQVWLLRTTYTFVSQSTGNIQHSTN